MKRLFLLLTLASAMPLAALAQDDDLYFTPSKAAPTTNEAPAYYSGSKRSVDDYNRYGIRSMYQKIGRDSLGNSMVRFRPGYGVLPDTTYVDTAYIGRALGANDYTYTRRMSRWDGFYDPWFYGYYGPWRWGYAGYYSPWYYYNGWYDPWYYDYAGWYDPWYYGYGGWYNPWYYGYGGWYGWGYPYYGWYGWGWPSGGYVYNGGNPRGYTGTRTWGLNDHASNSGVRFGRGSSTRGNNDGNTYTWRSQSNRSFGSRTNYPSRSNNNTSFGSTRSSSFGGSFGGGSFGGGGGSFSGGGFGGGHSSAGGGGHFGGGRR